MNTWAGILRRFGGETYSPPKKTETPPKISNINLRIESETVFSSNVFVPQQIFFELSTSNLPNK